MHHESKAQIVLKGEGKMVVFGILFYRFSCFLAIYNTETR